MLYTYPCIQEGGPDYYLLGMKSRNRAFQNDVVVVQVLPKDQWTVSDVYNNYYSHAYTISLYIDCK